MKELKGIAALDPIMGALEPDQERAINEAPREEKLRIMSDMTGISERELVAIFARALGLQFIEKFEMPEQPTDILPLRMILGFRCLPIKAPKGWESDLCLAVSWPPDERIRQWVYTVARRQVRWFLTDPERLANTLYQRFGVGSESLDDKSLDAVLDKEEEQEEEDENAAIIRFVNEVIAQAVRDRATDIHFEPRKEKLQIRYRIDGRLVPVSVPANLVSFQSAIISRIKIMSRLNISEKRRPQDGRITYGGGRGEEIDVRVSTLPTMYGESVSMRLLNESSQPTGIQDLGFLPDDEEVLNKVLEMPHGIMLITGPTGSGKSTTLSAFMRQIGTPERRVITVEDPIEYEIPEVNQTQVQHEIGLTFASALRSVLRQDPDVIMVGEIRDRDTADIAVRASLTGHLVLSTLHTNDAAGAITRLIDMEIEPFLIASSVELVIAQRLIRRLCPHCAKVHEIDITQLGSCLLSLGIPAEEVVHADHLKMAGGCDQCRGLGFRGRIGMFEMLKVNESIHDLIIKEASAREIKQRALANGMRTLQACGWEHAKAGRTSLSEIMRYAEISEEARNGAE